jgi:hypothetical protein
VIEALKKELKNGEQYIENISNVKEKLKSKIDANFDYAIEILGQANSATLESD